MAHPRKHGTAFHRAWTVMEEAQDFGDGIVGVSLNGVPEDDRAETPEESAKTARRRKSKV